MKINEIIAESTSSNLTAPIPGMIKMPQIDGNGNAYHAYRFGVALAGSPDFPQDVTTDSSVAPGFVMTRYSDADEEIVSAAAKKMGIKADQVTSAKSKEATTTNSTSPIATIKRNKYGI
jgi:hypothetical protein